MSPPTPPDCLHRDGIVHVDARDRLRAVTAAAARWLADHGGGAAALDDLPLAPDQRAALVRAAPVSWRAPGEAWELQLRTVDGERWLTIVDVGDRERGEARRLELARVRSLAGIASNIAHDLNNQFNAALGLVGQALLVMTGDDDRALLRDLERGIQAGGRMTSVLARWLARDAVGAEVLEPASLLEDALSVVRKAIVADDVDLHVAVDEALPTVRASRVEAGQAIMQGVLTILAAGPATLRLALAQPEGAADVVRLAVVAEGLPRGAVEGLVAAAQAARGALAHLARRMELEDVLTAAIAQRRTGGGLAATALPNGVRLDYDWPVERSPGAR